MIGARIVEPSSKLAAIRGFHSETLTPRSPPCSVWTDAVENPTLTRDQSIENALTKRPLQEGSPGLHGLRSPAPATRAMSVGRLQTAF